MKRKDSNTAHRMNDKMLRVCQVEAKFCATYYVAKTAKQLLTSEGIVAPSNPMPGKALKPTANVSHQFFYKSDQTSLRKPLNQWDKAKCIITGFVQILENLENTGI